MIGCHRNGDLQTRRSASKPDHHSKCHLIRPPIIALSARRKPNLKLESVIVRSISGYTGLANGSRPGMKHVKGVGLRRLTNVKCVRRTIHAHELAHIHCIIARGVRTNKIFDPFPFLSSNIALPEIPASRIQPAALPVYDL